jgi:Ca2+-binding RTX toxin-like protein
MSVAGTPASAEHVRECDRRGSNSRCAVGVDGAAGARCLLLVRAAGGINSEVNPSTRQFRGGTDGDDVESAVWPSEVYCGFGGNDTVQFLEGDFSDGGIFYGGPGDDDVYVNSRNAVFHGGAGNEYVESNSGLYFGGDGDDRALENHGAFDGGPGTDSILLPQFSTGTCTQVEIGCPTP